MKVYRLEPSQLDIAQEVVKNLWNKNHIYVKNKDFLYWSYYRPDINQESGFYVIEDECGIFGCIGKMPIVGHEYGKEIKTSVISLYVVSKEHRASGSGIKLLDEVFVNNDLVIINGINKRVSLLYKLKGCQIFDFPRYCLISSQEAYDKYCRDFNFVDKQNVNYCNEIKASNCLDLDFVNLSSNNKELWVNFWNQHKLQTKGIVKDFSYISWRYINHPIFEYTVNLIQRKNEVKGLLVYRKISLPNRQEIIRVVDLITNDNEIKETSLQKLYKENQQALAIEFFELHDSSWCRNIGAISAKNILSVYFAPPSPDNTNILSAVKSQYSFEDLYFSLADGDQDRPS